ncbi:MAG TPA: DUF4180 domain-containing protein [Ktedonobacteraceae bacterium]|nr:DUF4180 domain-containing protein [Ktedonobacteraceae bacterium]
MADTVNVIQGIRVLVCAEDGEKLQGEREAVDLIGEAMGEEATLVLVPVARLGDEFFQLKTRQAGHIVQKFVNYRRRLVILGDISHYVAQSRAFHDFVHEANRGTQLWFVKDLPELNARLAHAQP